MDNRFDAATLKREKWLKYLVITTNDSVNRERVERISDICEHESLNYVLRSLNILEQELEKNTVIGERGKGIIKRVLQWSEVAKGGSALQRKKWLEKGYPLAIHNLASARIYMDDTEDDKEDSAITELLIRTHGAVGQSIRGEVSVSQNYELTELRKYFDKKELYEILFVLNKCIIKAADEALWTLALEDKVKHIIDGIVEGKLEELEPSERLKRLSPIYRNCDESELAESVELFSRDIFPKYELWFFESALSEFSQEEIRKMISKILASELLEKASYITFKPLQDTLYYDYEGKKRVNIYKKRIIEKCLKTGTNDNVRLSITLENNALKVDYEFSSVCEKLIDFCVEAERSGILTFEKSIMILYDMFGFRRDEFDRLNNEEKYLATMNDVEESTKNSIIDYAVGDTIVDVGSGGGVLLDLLEQTYQDKHIIGTDISTNVIDVLNEKRVKENHNWTVIRHNFVDHALSEGKATTIIFSSILHEIYSYTETEQGRFQIESVKKALSHAYHSLPKGGRIIIRDGVKSPGDESHRTLAFSFKDHSGLDFFHNYRKDFKGLTEVDRESIIEDGLHVVGDYNFMREFLYTYTWGSESYACEVNEQFGYFTLTEFKKFFSELGATIIKAEEFVEQGYIDHLSETVDLPADQYPMSNCIVVIEK